MSSERRRARSPIVFAVLALTVSVPVLSASEKTWRTIDELSNEEKSQIDLRTDTPRDPQMPYLPAERFPFEAPYTAEELGYRSMDFYHVSRWDHAMVDVFGVLTSGGYLSQLALVGLIVHNGRDGLEGELYDVPPGKAWTRMALYYTFPPEFEDAQDLYVVYRTDPRATTKMDWFAYAPSLRRIRRQPEPRRGERFPNNVQSFDDVVGRPAWEFEWRFLGADVLHETVRFPNTRPTITLATGPFEFEDVPTPSLRMMGAEYPFYRDDGGVDCYVVEAVTRRDWLSAYPTEKILYWLDRHYFYPLRVEHYDRQGALHLVEVRLGKLENPKLGPRGYAAFSTVYYDPQLDMMSYSVHDAHTVKEWTDKDRGILFSPDFMRRQWRVEPLKSQVLVGSPSQFFMRPLLYPEKFPESRKIVLAPRVERLIQAQEEAGHLVFELD